MAEGIGQTLTSKAGPLPVWAWAGLGTAGLAGYMIYRNKKNASAAAAAAQNQQQPLADSSNLGTVPISQLTTAAQPMPIQMGDTFVNTAQSQSQTAGAAATGSGNASVTGTATSASGPGNPTSASSSSSSSATPKPAPTPVPIAPTKPPPPPSVKPPTAAPAPVPSQPAKQQTVTVCPWPSWCGSLWGIAQQLWGNGNLWPTLYNANKGLIGANPNLIHPGQVLTIPAKPA